MTAAPVPNRGRLARYGWPVGIAAVLVVSVGFNIVVMLVARHDPAFAIEPDYYARAVHWDDAMAQERTNQALGWQGQGELQLGEPGGAGLLRVSLSDAAGLPIGHAEVTAEAMHNARAASRRIVALSERQPGVYEAALDASRPGEWEVRVDARRGAERFVQRLRLTARAPTGGGAR